MSSDQQEQGDQSISDNSAGQQMDMEYFKITLKEYLKVTEEIKALQKAMKQRRDRLGDLEATLLAFLVKNDIKEVNLEGSYQGQDLIPLHQQRVKAPSAGSIIDIIKAKLADKPELLKDITATIEGMKETVEVDKIKIGKASSGKEKIAKVARPKAVKPVSSEASAASTALLLGVGSSE